MSDFNQNSGYGRALLDAVHGIIPVFGRVFIVCSTSDATDPNYQMLQEVCKEDDTGVLRFYTSLAEAYAAVTSNNNDVILLDGHTSHALTSMLTVAKNRVHFLGMEGGGRLNSQGAKITLATAVAGDTAVIKNTGTRNTFRNIKMIMSGTNAAQVNSFDDSGEGTFCLNCHFSHTTLLTTAAVSPLKFAGDTCHYKRCQIGDPTVYRTGASQMACRIAQYARYSYFEECEFVNYSSQTSAMLVGCDNATSVIGWVKFTRCGLNGSLLGDGTTAGALPAVGMVSALTSGYLLLDECASFNCTIIASTHASILNKGQASAATAGGGIAVAGA